MKKVTLFLFAVSLLLASVLAWNTPGADFSGVLKLEGMVSSARNPWGWEVGQGNENLDVEPQIRRGGVTVAMPTITILRGKTILTTPAGREGLSPRVSYGKGEEGFSLVWTDVGIADVTLPVNGDNNVHAGTFSFRMRAIGVLRHVQNGQPVYASVYNDMNANGLPGENGVSCDDNVCYLKKMFRGEGPSWLNILYELSASVGLSHFSDTTLRQVEGVYGAQTLAGFGKLRLDGAIPERWRVSLPVSIEYQ